MSGLEHLTNTKEIDYEDFRKLTKVEIDGAVYAYDGGSGRVKPDNEENRLAYIKFLLSKSKGRKIIYLYETDKKFEIRVEKDGALVVDIENYTTERSIHMLAHAILGLCDDDLQKAVFSMIEELAKAAYED